MVEELSQPRESHEEIPSPIPQSGEIREEFHFSTLVFEVVADIVVVTTGILTRTQTTDLVVSPGARESPIAAPVDGGPL